MPCHALNDLTYIASIAVGFLALFLPLDDPILAFVEIVVAQLPLY